VLRPLVLPSNPINVNRGNNSLVITDYADNMRRLARIIAALDVPNASDVEVIPLKHSVAADMQPLVLRLVEGSGAGQGAAAGAPDGLFRTTLLADPRSNSLILRAANPARAQLVRSLVEKLDRAPAESSNGAAGNIYVVYLKNADAVRLAATLRAAMAAMASNAQSAPGGPVLQQASFQPNTQSGQGGQGGPGSGGQGAHGPLNNANQPSTGGQIQADPSTNSLIITAPEPQYRQMRAVIDKLDGRRAQVMIEALIVEVSDTAAAKFGLQWQSALGSRAMLGTNSTVAGSSILALTQALATRNPAGLQLVPGLNLGIAGKLGGQHILGAIASFFDSDKDANVLSKPNLLTLDNEEARIVIGQNVPFPTGSYANASGLVGVNPFTTVERKDVGLTLRVRPTINENGTVRLTIFQEASTVDANSIANVNGPTTSKRSIESSVLVEDGGLVMLGGLLSDTYGQVVEKVPLAGDIPVFGNLFKSQARTREKLNLTMFLRPAVMRHAASTEAFAHDRYDEIRGLLQHNEVLQGKPAFLQFAPR
jgi:general secretion pathway protein D